MLANRSVESICFLDKQKITKEAEVNGKVLMRRTEVVKSVSRIFLRQQQKSKILFFVTFERIEMQFITFEDRLCSCC